MGTLYALLAILLACSPGKKEQPLIRELNRHIVELPGRKALEYSDAFLHEVLDGDNYSVIGLGEAAHGAKTFFELKHRLFKYLVEYHDYKVLAYEFSFRTSLKVNDYIVNGTGDLDSLFAGELWIQDNYEVQNLVRWMRDYNMLQHARDKIYFVGIDNQLDAFYPVKTIDRINVYYPELIRQNSQLAVEISSMKHINYENITRKEYESRRSLFENLLARSRSYFQSEPELEQSFNSKLTLHLIECLIDSNQWLFNIFTGKKNMREVDMAQNLLWVKENYNSKIAIWAHTSHVQDNPNFYGDGEGSLGYHIKKSLNEEYLIISTAFTKGKFTAVMEGPDGEDTLPLICEISGNPPSESFNDVFCQAKYENFFLDVRKIRASSPLHSYLGTVRPMLGIGDFFAGSAELHYSTSDRKINILEATDLIFYYSQTEALTLHERFK